MPLYDELFSNKKQVTHDVRFCKYVKHAISYIAICVNKTFFSAITRHLEMSIALKNTSSPQGIFVQCVETFQ